MAHRHDHLDHTGHTGGGLGVTDVRLERAEPQRPVLRPFLAVGGDEGFRLDRVAELRPRTVCLHGVDIGGRESGGRQGLADDALLGRAVGCRESVGRAVLVDGAAPDDGEHLVAVAAGVGEPFHQEHGDALGPARAVRAGRERLAPAVRRQAALAAELHEHAGCGHHRDATGQGHRALAAAQ
ncbi:hypothetical protein GCM10010422_01700 [Streptomyces graminearus]|uniref:Uncharacterized protein n=1 Tax=Streptomyces graminearus TaxID=284030 RepID=A0ABP5XVM0_9ACTN